MQKFGIDEGSDAELIDDVNSSTDSNDSSSSGSSFSEMKSNETEDSFDIEKMGQLVRPVIADRVNAWPVKGIDFQLKTVDPSVTVEEWLQANQEFTTTTTKEYTKTVINENRKSITITKKTRTTTTSIRSMSVYRNEAGNENQGEAIFDNKPAVAEIVSTKDQTNPISSKKFHMPNKPREPSAVSKIVNVQRRDNKVTSPVKVKRLSPQKKPMMRNCKKTERTSKKMDSNAQMVANGFNNEDDNRRSVHKKSDRPSSHSRRRDTPFNARKQIVIYSPGAGKTFGTKIDDEFISVTKNDFEQRIDPKYLQCQDLSSMKAITVRANQSIVYEPPSYGTTETNSNDDSETDDDLLTSYTRTGHFIRLNSK